MSSRGQTEFEIRRAFTDMLDDLENRAPEVYGRVLDKAEKFESEWKASRWDGDLSSGFDFKQLGTESGQYRVCQIELTRDYRAAILFPQVGTAAYWLDLWKKTKRNNRKEVATALKRAETDWASIQG